MPPTPVPREFPKMDFQESLSWQVSKRVLQYNITRVSQESEQREASQILLVISRGCSEWVSKNDPNQVFQDNAPWFPKEFPKMVTLDTCQRKFSQRALRKSFPREFVKMGSEEVHRERFRIKLSRVFPRRKCPRCCRSGFSGEFGDLSERAPRTSFQGHFPKRLSQ